MIVALQENHTFITDLETFESVINLDTLIDTVTQYDNTTFIHVEVC